MTTKKREPIEDYDINITNFVRDVIDEHPDSAEMTKQDLRDWAQGVLSISEDAISAMVENLVEALSPSAEEDDEDADIGEEEGDADG